LSFHPLAQSQSRGYSCVMQGFLLFALLCIVPTAQAAVWDRLQAPLTRYVQANIEENEGFYLIEDADQINAWMADFKSFDRKNIIRTGSGYIVHGKFMEKPAAGESQAGGAVLLIDFTLERRGKRWRVVDEALRSINRKVFFTYDRSGERIFSDPSEMLMVVIEEDAPPPDQDVGPDGDGNSSMGGEISGDRHNDPRRKRYNGPGNQPNDDGDGPDSEGTGPSRGQGSFGGSPSAVHNSR
jgi:hypothetical protein